MNSSSGLQWDVGGLLTSISSRQRSAICGRPLLKQTDFEPTVCSYRQTHIVQRQKPTLMPHLQLTSGVWTQIYWITVLLLSEVLD